LVLPLGSQSDKLRPARLLSRSLTKRRTRRTFIEHEFFGLEGPSAKFRDRYGQEGRTIRGLTVEQHLARLRESLIPLAERCGRVMREAVAALETLCAAPSPAVERSKPIKIVFGQRENAAPTVVNAYDQS
jgi:hypothetical protein